jgi:stage V sporulation protein G
VQITEIRIKLMEEAGERLQAFCSITFDDCFVIRDLKIIEGTNGPFVAMPSRKLTSHCLQCGAKNHLRANFCNECGAKQNPNRAPLDEDGRAKLYADIAHPINSACREMIQEYIIREFHDELERAKQPGYVSRYEDADLDGYAMTRNTRGFNRSHPTTNYARPNDRGGRNQRNNNAPPPRHNQRPPVPPVVNKVEAPAVEPRPIEAPVNDAPIAASPPPDGFGNGIF